MATFTSHAARPLTTLVPLDASCNPMSLSSNTLLIQPHYTRHLSAISQPADLESGDYVSDPAGRDRPASMMIMYRDNIHQRSLETNSLDKNLTSSQSDCDKARDEQLEEAESESLTHDIIKSPSSSVSENNSRFWSSPYLSIDEAEIWGHGRASMSATGDGRQPPYPPPNNTNRASSQKKDLGEGLDWNKILMRCRSESNLVFLKSRDRSRFYEKVVTLEENKEDEERWREEGDVGELDLLWPPKAKILVET
ncbi:hypothetical protein CBER1_06044 [Cercospora berteroae]|uniref:Uncharacterized protein n=1 Tax=Cercospora berteroae TaxID=357750 RepID=A0A2S6C562_9PEZI|nr:hypothetical protein CBER1_06044 [Cercospora berteroae]